MSEAIVFENSRGQKIVGVLDGPEKNAPLVLALHGFGGTKESNQEFSDILNPLGIATLRIDFSGSGESDGKYEDKTITGFIDDAQSALNFVLSFQHRTFDFNKIGIVGHSMGAVTGILVSAKDSRVSTLVASCPAVKEAEAIASFYDPEDFATASEKGYVEKTIMGDNRRLNYTFFEDAKQYDLIQEAVKIPYEFLLIGAEKDQVVSYEQITELAKATKAKLLSLPNSDHGLEADWPVAEEAIRNWFREWVK